MSQPQGFADPCFPSHVCKLHKSLYGLKQVPRAWFDRFSYYLAGIGFSRIHIDSSLFVCPSKGSITILLLYVDDLVLTGNDSCYISFLISQLSVVFKMKILGHLHHFLGIEVNPVPNGLFLSQFKYPKDLLVRSSMLEAKPCGSPSCHKQPISQSASPLLADPTSYRNITGRSSSIPHTYQAFFGFCCKSAVSTPPSTYYSQLHCTRTCPALSQRLPHLWHFLSARFPSSHMLLRR